MAVAYCVASHGPRDQPQRLVNALLADDGEARVLIHHDPRSEALDPAWLRSCADRVTQMRPRPISWGSFDQVDLSVDFLRAAASLDASHYVVFLSGQDYPVRNLAGLEYELSRYDVWMEAWPLEESEPSWPGLFRCSYRWRRSTQPEPIHRILYRLTPLPAPDAARTHRLVLMESREGQLWWGARMRRAFPLPVYGGSNWMSLSIDAARGILAAPTRFPEAWRRFRRVPNPDEACFQTLLRATPDLTYAPDHARYIKWENGDGPLILTTEDLPALIGSGAHFARKFVSSHDDVLDRLDEAAGRL